MLQAENLNVDKHCENGCPTIDLSSSRGSTVEMGMPVEAAVPTPIEAFYEEVIESNPIGNAPVEAIAETNTDFIRLDQPENQFQIQTPKPTTPPSESYDYFRR